MLVRLERLAQPLLGEQPLEHGLDVVRLAEHAVDARAAASGADDGEVARPHVAGLLAVEDERSRRLEVRLADEQLAAALDLDDDELGRH